MQIQRVEINMFGKVKSCWKGDSGQLFKFSIIETRDANNCS